MINQGLEEERLKKKELKILEKETEQIVEIINKIVSNKDAIFCRKYLLLEKNKYTEPDKIIMMIFF